MEDCGFGAEALAPGASASSPSAALEQELAGLRRAFYQSLAFTLPVFVVSMVLPWIPGTQKFREVRSGGTDRRWVGATQAAHRLLECAAGVLLAPQAARRWRKEGEALTWMRRRFKIQPATPCPCAASPPLHRRQSWISPPPRCSSGSW